MSSRKSSSTIVATPKLVHSAIAGVCGGAVVGLALMGFQSHLHSNHASDISSKIDGLAESSARSSGTGQLDPASLVDAIDMVMAQREERERSQQRDEIMAKYADYATDVEDGEWLIGDPDARFTLYTFADTQCTFCQRHHPTPKALVEGSGGMVNAQYHHMSIMAPLSEVHAVASECAGRLGGNPTFWAFIDKVYEEPSLSRTDMPALAGSLGLDSSEFQQCMSSSEINNHIRQLGSEASRQGINSTPTTIIIDRQTGRTETIAGAQHPAQFIELIRDMLQASAADDQTRDAG